ncbi:MAG: efflux RND transporter periplasmic adaptor subunit [Gammaproteobacteria bacterium]
MNVLLRALALNVGLGFVVSGSAAPAIQVPELDCVIEPHVVIDLSSRTDGIVETIEVERGDIVTQDQIVVRLEAGVERAVADYARAAAEADSDLAAGEVSMDFAERRRDRLESLYLEKALSSDQMDEMDTEARLSKLKFDQARERRRLATLELRRALEVLERHTVRSPIDGVVVQHFLAPGESVEEKPILRLAQIDPLRVEVMVPIAYIGAFEVGQQAVVSPERPIRDSYPAVVTVVDRVADAASGTFLVRMNLPNPEHKLPSGLNCMVRFMAKPIPEALQASSNAAPDPRENNTATGAPAVVARKRTPTAIDAESKPAKQYIAHAGLATSKPVGESVRPRPDAAREASGSVARLTASSRAGNALGACRTIGPIGDGARARALQAALGANGNSASVREETTAMPNGFIIVSDDQGGVAEAKTLAENMQGAGLNDMFVFARGPHKGRVSLGLYRNEVMAHERVGEIASAGFAAEARPRQRDVTRYWVDVAGERVELAKDAHGLLAELAVTPVDCGRTLAADR